MRAALAWVLCLPVGAQVDLGLPRDRETLGYRMFDLRLEIEQLLSSPWQYVDVVTEYFGSGVVGDYDERTSGVSSSLTRVLSPTTGRRYREGNTMTATMSLMFSVVKSSSRYFELWRSRAQGSPLRRERYTPSNERSSLCSVPGST